jgi:hypothetical protein
VTKHIPPVDTTVLPNVLAMISLPASAGLAHKTAMDEARRNLGMGMFL